MKSYWLVNLEVHPRGNPRITLYKLGDIIYALLTKPRNLRYKLGINLRYKFILKFFSIPFTIMPWGV